MRSLTSRISASTRMPLGAGSGVRGDLDPDRRAVRPAQPQQVVGDRAVALQPLDEPVARLRVDEALQSRTGGPPLRRLRGIAENQLEIRIGRERLARRRRDVPM